MHVSGVSQCLIKPWGLLRGLAVLALAAWVGGLAWQVWTGGAEAGAPLGMPLAGEVDHRFDGISPWARAQIPRAIRFDVPMGTDHGGMAYNAQAFWEMNEKRGGRHLGEDLNGIGGMNTDLGDPVFSPADGLVIHAGESSPGWGKIIVIAHTTADGRSLHSMFAHLDRIDVKTGSLVARGARVGTVGTANGHYPAHLHFELRVSDGVDIGAGYAMHPGNRLDPLATIASLRNAEASNLSVSPLALVLASRGVHSR